MTYDNRILDIILLLLLLTQGQGIDLDNSVMFMSKFCVKVFFCKHF